MRRGAAALLFALSTSLLFGCGESVGEGSKRLAVAGPRWWFSHLPVALVATPSGVLAGRETSLTVAVGSNVAGKWKSAGKPTRIWIPGRHFELGANLVAIKTGTERTTLNVQVISGVWLAMPVAISIAIAWALVSRWRRRRAG